MFRELMPILNGRQLLLTVSRVDDATLRVCIVPKRLKDDAGENGLCTPLTVTGTPEELDREFATQVSGYTASVVKLSSNLGAIEAAHTAALKAVGEEKKKELDRKRGKPSAATSSAATQTSAGPTIQNGKPVFGTKNGASSGEPMNLFDAPSGSGEATTDEAAVRVDEAVSAEEATSPEESSCSGEFGSNGRTKREG
jgi:PRTRC genetic system protein E